MTDLSIVIPVFNEESNIKILYNEIITSIDFTDDYEIIFIDDGSNDNSLEMIKLLAKDDTKVKLISNVSNYGQSKSIYNGIINSKSNNILTIDADLQNDPVDIPILYNVYKKNYSNCLVSGVRKKRMDSNLKKISSYLANKIRSFYLQDNCKDTGCSLKMFPKKIFLKFDFFDGMHRFIPALFIGFGYSVYYVDVNHRHRIYGKTKYGVFNRIIINIKNMIYVKRIIKNYKRNLNDI